MTSPVFVVPADALATAAAGSIVELGGPEGRHASSVVRLASGEALDLVDGCGRRARGTVDSVVDKQTLAVRVTDVEDEAVPAMQISVVQALPKGDRGELAVELLTEIGVDAIVPWSASRCITQWKGERGDKGHRKWLDAAAAAGKQSRRARFPVVHPLSSTAQVCDLISAASATLVLDENASLSLADVALPDSGDVVVVVGPEGGIAGDELDRFVRAGAVAVRLGPTVLRTSTAGLAAASIVLSRSSRWAGPSHTRSVEG